MTGAGDSHLGPCPRRQVAQLDQEDVLPGLFQQHSSLPVLHGVLVLGGGSGFLLNLKKGVKCQALPTLVLMTLPSTSASKPTTAASSSTGKENTHSMGLFSLEVHCQQEVTLKETDLLTYCWMTQT